MLGKTISHYRILEKLGEGGMGVVYRAEDTRLKRPVALKFLLPELTRDQVAKERFINEARAASTLDHTNICTVHEIGEIERTEGGPDVEEGRLFIVMAFYEGESLKAKIRNGPMNLEDAVSIAAQIAAGLTKAHRQGIVHRDVKPANVMVTSDGVVKVVDFGLALLAGQARMTRTGTTGGTAAYMSPEQVRGEPVDNRTDVWSLGVVLYEMVTGQLPFRGEYEPALIYSILNEKPRPVSLLRSDAPQGLERIIERALSKTLDERYQGVAEMITDLEGLCRQLATRVAGQPAAGVEGQPSGRAERTKKSVAVLPFRSLSDSREDEYFSDGTTEDILTQLSKIGELRVISRTSIMRYKHSEKSIPEIARELDVGAILEGSVRHVGDRVRIVAQLLDARTDEHIWAETYDREMKDIFAIQSDVAEKIAAALKATLSPAEKERIEKEPTANIEAYNYYLKAREYYCRYRKQDNETAVALFKKALELDPNYALAWAGLGDAYSQRFARYGMAISWLDAAIEASKKAIALDGSSAEAHKALGTAYIYKGLSTAALEALLTAIELNPNYYPAVNNVGSIYLDRGDLDKAISWLKKDAVMSPTSVFARTMLGESYRQLGDLARSEQLLRKALELQPDYVDGHYYLALTYLLQGKTREADDLVRSAASSNPDNPRVLEYAGIGMELLGDFAQAREYYQRSMSINGSFDTDSLAISGIGLGHILLREGKRDEAERLLDQARKLREKRVEEGDASVDVFCDLARIHAIAGRKKEAYEWLERAVAAGWKDYQMGQIDPWLENVRNDEQFKQVMAQVKGKVDEMRKRVEEMEEE